MSEVTSMVRKCLAIRMVVWFECGVAWCDEEFSGTCSVTLSGATPPCNANLRVLFSDESGMLQPLSAQSVSAFVTLMPTCSHRSVPSGGATDKHVLCMSLGVQG